ncbi:hypothetical protein [Oleiharenicola lentus]|uniref:hypothetical protein n=1 Tax=Oleiharenicola lentus TaxID=2508720 RepID=UPI003F664386
MANWEYKVISSGKGGFATPALMEKFINDLGQEQWEIINFHTPPDNSLAFTGLARRPTQRDWTLEDAAAAAARAETDKLRAEFEAKFKAGISGANAGATAAEEKAENFAEEKAAADDGFRRPVDTSRDGDPDAPEHTEDEWQKLSAEDELPTFFDALKPHMRRNQRGPGMSVGLDFLAKKWKLEESDVKTALVECGLQIPADENAKPVYIEYDGDLFWVNINRRGEIWLNTREKPEPVFRIIEGKRLTEEETAVVEASMGGSQQHHAPAQQSHEAREPRPQPERREQAPRQPQQPAAQPAPAQPRAENQQPQGEKTFLAKVRSMMRRNRRGRGGSGSFQFLTKALKLDEAGLLAKLGEFGLRLDESGKHVIANEGGFDYWLNKNSRGEIWINAEESRGGGGQPAASAPGEGASAAAVNADSESGEKSTYVMPDGPAGDAHDAGPMGNVFAPKSKAVEEVQPLPVNTLSAVRLLMEPKKRGEGVTAPIPELAEKLEKSEDQILAALAAAGLELPASPKDKPTFAELNGEIFWLNVNAKGQVWLNAKASKKTKSKKSAE